MDDLELKNNIIVDLYDLKLSTGCIHRLMSAGIKTLNDLIDSDIDSVKGLGIISIQKIQGIIAQADTIFSDFAQQQGKISKIYKDISHVDLSGLPLSTRATNALRLANINSAGDLIRMSKREVMELDGIGQKTRNEILGAIDGLMANGIGYLKKLELPEESITADTGSGQDHSNTETKGFDYPLIDRLKRDFSWKTSILAAQFGCSKTNIYDILKRRPEKRYAKWTGKRMSQQEEELLQELIVSNKSEYCDEKVACYLLSNRRDNFVCLFFYADNIKGFLLEDLPSSLQTKVIESNFTTDSEVGQDHSSTEMKGFDYPLIDRLRQEFSWKTAILAVQFGCSRQNIFNILDRRPEGRYVKWTGKEMTQQEEELLQGLIASKKSKYCDEKVACYLLNNRRDNFVCLFFYADNTKCFFLKDLPSSLQAQVIESNLTRMTVEESAVVSAGTVVSILKQKSFVPDPADKEQFHRLAALRGMRVNEYSLSLTGLPLASSNQITDDKVIQFLEAHQVNGEVFISSKSDNSWIVNFARKNGYSIDELIELYGYKVAGNGPAWSNEEDEILYQYFTIEGSHVVHRLPGKSPRMCSDRAKELGIGFRGLRWTKDEDDIIRQFYSIEGLNVSNRLPKRTPIACKLRARKLGIEYTEADFNHKLWTDEEEDIVRRYYPTLGKAVAEMLPGRTDVAISGKFYKLVKEGANRERTDPESAVLKLPGKATWTTEEDAIICEYYPFERSKTIHRLPGKTVGELSYRAKKLGVSFQTNARWTQEEDDILRQFYPLEGDIVYKRLPGRTQQTCWVRARQLKIRFINAHKNRRAWTEAEDDIIRHNYASKGSLISELLPGRSVCAIRQRVVKIMNQKSEPTSNIPKPARPRKLHESGWSSEEDNILREYYPVEGVRVVNRLPNRTAKACMRRVAKLGVLYRNRMRWTDEENNIIREFFPSEGSKVCDRLPGRTRNKCVVHAYQLGIEYNGPSKKNKQWTEDEDNILNMYYPTEGSRVVNRLPRHTAEACKARAVKLRISYRSRIRWSEEEDAIVLRDYPIKGAAIVELLPRRTALAIHQRFNKLTRTERMKAKDTSDADSTELPDKEN